jgi:uncharacterized protein (DUF362 family)
VSRVSIVRCDDQNIKGCVKKSIDMLNTVSFSDSDVVVIKPNLCDLKSSAKGVTTDPRIVEAVIDYIRQKADPVIIIVESDHWIATAEEEFVRLGYRNLAEKLDVELVNLSKDEIFEIELDGKYFKTFDTPKTLLVATKFISIAQLKTHTQVRMTCIMKNQFGLISRRLKSKHHPYMSEVLFDINKLFKPDLCVVDALVGMEGTGPADGLPIRVGLIISGTNPVATDAIAATIMGFKPRSIPYLKYAEKHGLGSISKIELFGEPIDKVKQKFEFIPWFSYALYRMSFRMKRVGVMIERFFDKLASFTDITATGLIVLRRGFVVGPGSGATTLSNGIQYIKEVIKLFFVRVRRGWKHI